MNLSRQFKIIRNRFNMCEAIRVKQILLWHSLETKHDKCVSAQNVAYLRIKVGYNIQIVLQKHEIEMR